MFCYVDLSHAHYGVEDRLKMSEEDGKSPQGTGPALTYFLGKVFLR